MLPWTLTDTQAKNIYNALYKWYNSPSNFPNYQTGAGVFFNFPNYTLDKLYYTIEYLKKNYGLGWFTDDFSARTNAIAKIAAGLSEVFDGQVSQDGIKKFCTWVYNFAKQNEAATKYFTSGGSFNVIDTAAVALDEVVIKPASQALENVSYAIQYPSLASITPNFSTLIKWGAIVGGVLYLWKFLENRSNRI